METSSVGGENTRCKIRLALGLILVSAIILPRLSAQADDLIRLYDEWLVLRSHDVTGAGYFFDTKYGPPQAVKVCQELVAAGPNLVPRLVDFSKGNGKEFHHFKTLMLLDHISGINYYRGREEKVTSEGIWQSFVTAWDRGEYASPQRGLLESGWQDLQSVNTTEKPFASDFWALRRLGVWGLPFLIEKLIDSNSPYLFAVFLINSDQRKLSQTYVANHRDFYPTIQEKIAAIHNWHLKRRHTMTDLGDLNARITRALQQSGVPGVGGTEQIPLADPPNFPVAIPPGIKLTPAGLKMLNASTSISDPNTQALVAAPVVGVPPSVAPSPRQPEKRLLVLLGSTGVALLALLLGWLLFRKRS